MPTLMKNPAGLMAAIWCVAVLTTVSAPLSRAADSGVEKLQWHDTPKAVPDTAFQDGYGADVSLADFKGKVVVVNLWATWCAPCIREMPTLDTLQADLGGDTLEVVALSQDREGARVAKLFIETNGWENLALYVSDGSTFARAAGIRGLPTTLIIAPDGSEVARLEGTAEWDSDEIKAVLLGLIEPQG